MSTFNHTTEFVIEHCYKCGVQFAVTREFHARCLEKGPDKTFYCPNGHGQVYRDSEATRLRRELDRARQRAVDEATRANAAATRAAALERASQRVRQRLKNGVCPCCSRQFPELLAHMRSKHPEYGGGQSLRTVRMQLGLTQALVAEELGLPASYVSMYERDHEALPDHAREKLDRWLLEVA